ncbi:Dam family site-specific DNA-(adenine-N6)-methyltransferase [Marinilactibacillus psychrotolerans]|uniref:Dam family site-specific DNA-(adenine-N6)-methyltransferase n=1 Tax=Marinilactibacillus psychrotolerans TaxID=191770 RepID=UPI0038886CA1
MTKLKIQQRRYIGSKTKLLSFIEEILEKEGIEFNTFADIFAGTGVVGGYFNNKADIIFNDILYSNYLSYVAFFSDEKINIQKLSSLIESYNTQDISTLADNYMSDNFGDTYFSYMNCKLIGFIREDINSLYTNKEINHREMAYLITSLIYSMDRIANTVGHYDAYRKTDDLNKDLILKELDISSSKNNQNNSIFNSDANDLVKDIESDVVYIDTPYNSRQYSDAYHLLENVANWKKPEVKGIARKMDRTSLKSRYSLKTAPQAFSELIKDIQAKYILVSYNNMGNSGNGRSQAKMSDYDIVSALERRGTVTVYETSFKQFTTGSSNKDDLKERIFLCKTNDYEKKTVVKPNILKEKKQNTKKKHAKSPLNYTGGKYKLLDKLYNVFPEKIDHFYDVFSGGANVGINMKANNILCIDNNTKVIKLLNYLNHHNFEYVHQSILGVIEYFGLSQSYLNGYEYYGCVSSKGLGSYNKEKYLKLRDYYNNKKFDLFDENILFLTLIIYGFNNQIRFNQKGNFNMPVGKRDYNGNTRRNISNFIEQTNTKKISFESMDFRVLMNINFTANDLVYLDPPYLLGTASYNESGGWTENDELDLYSLLDFLDVRGVKFALSNVIEHKGKRNEFMEKWLNKNSYTMIDMKYNYNNSNYQSTAGKGKTNEVLIINY